MSTSNSDNESEHTLPSSSPKGKQKAFFNPTAALKNTTTASSSSSLSPGAIVVQQALHVGSISNHIKVVLQQSPPNYAMWRHVFLVNLGKFNLLSHVDGTPPSDDESWALLDFNVMSWIYATIDPEIFALIMKIDDSAFHVWTAIENLFRDNKKARAIQLESEFRGLRQGSLSINDYCKQLKALADGLADVNNPVSDENLALQTINGLNESFSNIRSLIQFQKPFPTFQEVRSSLILEETCRANMAPPASALTATTGAVSSPPPASGGSSSQPRSTNPVAPLPQQQPPRNYNSNGRPQRRPRGGNDRVRGRGYGRGNLQQQLWNLLNGNANWNKPWNSQGLLGPRPTTPQQAMFSQQSTPSWDQQRLVNSMNALTIPQQRNVDPSWFMDTGASSHMSPNAGSFQQDCDPSVQ